MRIEDRLRKETNFADALIIKEMRREMDALEDAFFELVQRVGTELGWDNPTSVIDAIGGVNKTIEWQMAVQAWNNAWERDHA